ncbi:MAG TPA: glycosyltransferase, partial [Thermoanaerobaculia bacterium]
LLRQAIDSVRANEHPAEIVVVNDGGAPPQLEQSVKLVQNERPTGRSEAMNAGVRTATTKYVAFLDDDDLYFAEHLSTLAAAAQTAPTSAAWYTDAVSTFLSMGGTGNYEKHASLRLFGGDFDRELLLIDNYIPLPTLLVERAVFLDVGGFDRQFDLFEDWDFLIRLSQRGDFTHVPRITCEIRRFEGGGSILLASPVGSQRFREAKLQVWSKHAALISNDTFANVFERQKRKSIALEASVVEEKGRRAQAENENARMEREKAQLIAEIQSMHNAINERTMYIKDLEGALQVLRREAELATSESERLLKSIGVSEASRVEAEAHVRAAYAEIERLQGLLNMIYRSRTWKLHAMMERMRGRG